MKIAIAGTGYVGLSNAVLLAQHNEVIAVDIVQEKVDLIKKNISRVISAEEKTLSAQMTQKTLDASIELAK